MKLFGNYTALVTPFKNNLSLDLKSLTSLCDFQLQNCSDGIVALGSTAEASALNSYEKHKVMETITQTINNKIPVIAGVNAFSLEEALNQSQARFVDGANALLISPPPYIKPTQQGLFSYFTKLADHSLIPIILYNIPSRTATKLEEQTVVKLSSHPNIIGIKDAGGDITYTQNIIHNTLNNSFYILSGNDNQLFPILSLGGNGVISVAGNIIPKTFHQIIESYKNNQIKNSYNLYFQSLNLINCLSLETNPICIKYALSQLNLIKNNLRPPLTKLSQKNAKKIKKLIENISTNT